MSVIYCNINMFDYDQVVYLQEDDGGSRIYAKVPFSELDKFLAKTCDTEHINKIYLKGAMPFALEIRDRLKTNYDTKFGKAEDLEIIIVGEENE